MTPFRFVRFFLVVGLLATLWGGWAQARPLSAAETGTVTAAYAVNVRSGPGVGYSVVAVLYNSNNITLLGRNDSGTWVRVRTNAGQEGWVNANFVQTSSSVPSLAVVGTAPTIETTALVVGAQVVNVRSGDTIQHSVVTTVGYHTTVTLLGRNHNSSWAYIRTPNGTTGWINGNLLTPSTALANLPASASPLIPTAAPAPATAGTATITAGHLNVRRGDGIAYEVIASLNLGQQVNLIGRNASNTWAKVRLANGQEGWVNASYLNYSGGIGSLPLAAASAPPATHVAYVKTAALNVRSGPGLNFTPIGVVYDGQMVTMLGRDVSYGWVKVTTPAGQTGWVASGLITPNVPLNNLAVTQ